MRPRSQKALDQVGMDLVRRARTTLHEVLTCPDCHSTGRLEKMVDVEDGQRQIRYEECLCRSAAYDLMIELFAYEADRL